MEIRCIYFQKLDRFETVEIRHTVSRKAASERTGRSGRCRLAGIMFIPQDRERFRIRRDVHGTGVLELHCIALEFLDPVGLNGWRAGNKTT